MFCPPPLLQVCLSAFSRGTALTLLWDRKQGREQSSLRLLKLHLNPFRVTVTAVTAGPSRVSITWGRNTNAAKPRLGGEAGSSGSADLHVRACEPAGESDPSRQDGPC